MADVIFILISVFVCGFVVAFIVLAFASAAYRLHILRKLKRKLHPKNVQVCQIAVLDEDNIRQPEDVEIGSAPSDENNKQTFQVDAEMSTRSNVQPLPVASDINNVGLKPPVSARNTEGLQESQLTGAAETEEQLLGVGHLPKDIQAELEMRDNLKKTIGPLPPVLD